MTKKAGPPSSPDAVGQTALERALAEMIVSTLHLQLQPSDIRPETPLMGEGLGLTPIDILDVVLAICRTYCFKQQSEGVPYQQIFASLRSLSAYLEKHATRRSIAKRTIRYVKIGSFFLFAFATC